MAEYKFTCSSGENEATILLADGTLFGFPTWKCLEGDEVWGRPSSGSLLGPRLTAGQIELNLGSILNDWNATEGASGTGYRTDDNGGSFPTGDFRWITSPG